METLSLVLVAVLVVLTSILFSRRKKCKISLPGPTGLPIIGFFPFMTRYPHVKLKELSETFGPVYSIQLGSRKVVVLGDFDVIKEAFAQDAFVGRPSDPRLEFSKETIRTGAFFGLAWKEQRRFAIRMLKDLGLGKTKIDQLIEEEILELLGRMEEYVSSKVMMSDLLAPSTSNNVSSLLFGKRMVWGDPKRMELDRVIGEGGRLAVTVAWQMFFPWIVKCGRFIRIGNNERLRKCIDGLKTFVREELMSHETTFDPNNVRDFMDGYLLEIEKKKDDPNSSFHRNVLMDISRKYFGAGSDTVRIAVDWTLLIAAGKPEVQKKIHREIDEVIGKDRFPTWQDHINMPYTEAVICEVMRWTSIVPLNLMRYTLEDVELNGYHIPKGSYVLANVHAVNTDKVLWGEDEREFKPERFLSEDGAKVIKPEYFIPFSIGKRSCPGRTLAEIEVFLYVVAILKKFKMSLPPGTSADYEGILGIVMQPKRQHMSLSLRK